MTISTKSVLISLLSLLFFLPGQVQAERGLLPVQPAKHTQKLNKKQSKRPKARLGKKMYKKARKEQDFKRPRRWGYNYTVFTVIACGGGIFFMWYPGIWVEGVMLISVGAFIFLLAIALLFLAILSFMVASEIHNEYDH